MIDLNFAIAFGAGLVSFFAPCALPLLPTYIAYIGGYSLKEIGKKGKAYYRKKVIVSGMLYVLGFSLVFVLLGTAAGGVGIALRKYNRLIAFVGGLLIIYLGLEFGGFLNPLFLARKRGLKLPMWSERFKYIHPFLVGLVFATTWTPCVGAVLGAILALAAVSGTAIKGASLLFVYSLGISVPFIFVSLTLASAPKYLKVVSKHIGLITKIAGVALVILGILLLTDTYKYLNSWLFGVAFRMGYTIK